MSCKAGKVCSVYFCNEYEWQRGSVSFFTFPRDKETCAEWVRLSQRADLDTLLKKYGPERLRNNKICAKHFQPSDFKNPNLTSQGLKKKAIPSLNLSGWEDGAQCRRRVSKVRMREETEKAEHFHGKIEGETDAVCISASMEYLPDVKTETVWVEETKIQPEESHEFLLPFKETVCKTEEIPTSVSGTLSSEYGVEEDLKEETIIKDEKLMSPSEEARALPVLVHETQSEGIVPESNDSVTSSTKIGESYYCEPCDTQFARQSDFSRHMTRTHNQTNSHPCPKCGKIFRYRSKLVEHLVTHSDDKPFSCVFCNRQFARLADQKRHIKHSQHTSSTNVQCVRDSSHRKDNHIATLEHADEPDKIGKRLYFMDQKEINMKRNDHYCYQCCEPFTSKIGLMHHKKNVHSVTNAYQCRKCKDSFSDLSKLMEHDANHSSKMKISSKGLLSRPSLIEQEHEHTTKDPRLSKKHKNQNSKRDYSCAECGKIFSWPSRLKDHMLTHTKEKCFTCDYCKKGFARKSDLLYHISKHTSSTPVQYVKSHSLQVPS